MDHENTCRAGMLCQKLCASREREKSCLISFHYLIIEKQAARQEYKIREHSSCRTLFMLLSPTLNREVLGLYQNSEENNCLPLSSLSTPRSLMVSPGWEIMIGSAVSVMGRKIATFLVFVSTGEWLLHRHTD